MLTKKDVKKAQDEWGQAIVDIGQYISDRLQCEQVASEWLEKLYAFERGDLLFKPTKAAEIPFRPNRQGALSYFIGGYEDYPEDRGFAMEPWIAVRFDNAGIILEEDRAIAMGHYYFTDKTGEETKVEYTFGYVKTEQELLKIDVHHSSLPYSGA